jgi:hypothetical protein
MLLRGANGRLLFILGVSLSSQMGEEDEFGPGVSKKTKKPI